MEYVANPQNHEYLIAAMTYDILRRYKALKIVRNDSSFFCIGGVDFDKDHKVSVRRDFFKKKEYPFFHDNNRNFIADDIGWDRDSGCLTIYRSDGDIKVYCYKQYVPNDFDYVFMDNNETHDIFALFDDRVQDYDNTTVIDGDKYAVYDPSCFEKVPDFLRAECSKLLKADRYSDKLLKIYLVTYPQKEKLTFGIWDIEEKCPITDSSITVDSNDYLAYCLSRT